jgi:hypothetical protein
MFQVSLGGRKAEKKVRQSQRESAEMIQNQSKRRKNLPMAFRIDRNTFLYF